MHVWISRDKAKSDSGSDMVKVWKKEPSKGYPLRDDKIHLPYYDTRTIIFYDSVFPRNPGFIIMGKREFKDSFGFTPRKGSCKKHKLVLHNA